jgi:hypothetical protein
MIRQLSFPASGIVAVLRSGPVVLDFLVVLEGSLRAVPAVACGALHRV